MHTLWQIFYYHTLCNLNGIVAKVSIFVGLSKFDKTKFSFDKMPYTEQRRLILCATPSNLMTVKKAKLSSNCKHHKGKYLKGDITYFRAREHLGILQRMLKRAYDLVKYV